MEHEGLRKTELTCDPWPEQCADETERNGCHEPTLAAREGFADRAANRRDHDQHNERSDRDAIARCVKVSVALCTLPDRASTTRETVIDIGPLHATADRQTTLPLLRHAACWRPTTSVPL
jgi:hypothetical protein